MVRSFGLDPSSRGGAYALSFQPSVVLKISRKTFWVLAGIEPQASRPQSVGLPLSHREHKEHNLI